VDFGKYSGEKWTRVPVGYLKFVANSFYGERREMAEAELKRRGTVIRTMEVELSGHSIDRASKITMEWQLDGVYSWLLRMASEALIFAEKSEGDELIKYYGYKFVYNHGNYYDTLKTIMLDEKYENK
jgi:hypothetical protein